MNIKKILFFAMCLVCFMACSKDSPIDFGSSSTFTLIGKWGMESGTITDSDGTTKRYDNLGKGLYYQYIEYKVDGTLVKTTLPDKNIVYGVYTYNDASRELSYKYDGDLYYYPASINVLSSKEMIITTDFGHIGRITQHMVKL